MSLNTSADMEKDITVTSDKDISITSDVVDRFLQSKSNFGVVFQGKYRVSLNKIGFSKTF